jgi:hypothetical protein
MAVGIGFIGVLTATITSFFLDPVKATDQTNQIEDRLARIEEKLDALMRERDQRL